MFNRKITKLEGPMGDQIETSKKQHPNPNEKIWQSKAFKTFAAIYLSIGAYSLGKDAIEKVFPTVEKPIQYVTKTPKISNEFTDQEPKKEIKKQENLETKLKSFKLTNEIFTDKDYLTKDQIQSLLNNYNSCLKDKNTAQIIINAAQQYEINPLVLLVKLQQEQGLVSKQTATDEEFKYATGYGCFDNKEWRASRGLQEQIEKAAKCFKKHYNQFEQGEQIIIDEENLITVKNAAESALLHYTPWTDGKNLFIKLANQYTKKINTLKPRRDILQTRQNHYRKASNQ